MALAETRGIGLENLSLEDYQGISPLIEEGVYKVLEFGAAVARRGMQRVTNPEV